MKASLTFLLPAVILTIGLLFVLPMLDTPELSEATSHPTQETPPTHRTPPPLTHPRPPRPPAFPNRITLISDTATTQQLNSTDGTPAQDLETLEALITLYRRSMGENPVGLNEEITASLIGQNRKGVSVLPQSHQAINPEGQLVDRWGTPYFFHALSRTQLEIRSAGPDKQHYTSDDILNSQ